MPWCPVCKTEYREGITTCSDCGATLVEELTSDYDDFKEVAFIENDILAKKFIDYLEYSKIEAKSEPDADGTAFHILVHPDDVKKAKTEFLAFKQVEKDRMDRLISGLIEGDNAAADDSDGEDASAADYEIESIETLTVSPRKKRSSSFSRLPRMPPTSLPAYMLKKPIRHAKCPRQPIPSSVLPCCCLFFPF